MESSEFGRVSFLSMSTSAAELFLVKEDQEIVEYNVLRRSPNTLLDFQDDQCYHPATTAASSMDPAHDQLHHQAPEQENHQVMIQHHEEEEEEEEEEEDCSKRELMIIKKASSHNDQDQDQDQESDDNDGFKTPTSLDHKIPVIKQCPPAPRKPRRHLLSKRKLSSTPPNAARRSVLLDLSREVESLFPMPILADLHRKIKKSRRDA